jgi:hypothetical protein
MQNTEVFSMDIVDDEALMGMVVPGVFVLTLGHLGQPPAPASYGDFRHLLRAGGAEPLSSSSHRERTAALGFGLYSLDPFPDGESRQVGGLGGLQTIISVHACPVHTVHLQE